LIALSVFVRASVSSGIKLARERLQRLVYAFLRLSMCARLLLLLLLSVSIRYDACWNHRLCDGGSLSTRCRWQVGVLQTVGEIPHEACSQFRFHSDR
jgi:hypothetical protein